MYLQQIENKPENTVYSKLIAQVQQGKFHETKLSEISRGTSAIFANTTIFHAITCC